MCQHGVTEISESPPPLPSFPISTYNTRKDGQWCEVSLIRSLMWIVPWYFNVLDCISIIPRSISMTDALRTLYSCYSSEVHPIHDSHVMTLTTCLSDCNINRGDLVNIRICSPLRDTNIYLWLRVDLKIDYFQYRKLNSNDF